MLYARLYDQMIHITPRLWPEVMSSLINAAQGGPDAQHHLNGLRKRLEPLHPLCHWTPGPDDVPKLQQAVKVVHRLKVQGGLRTDADRHKFESLWKFPGPHWSALRDIALAHVSGHDARSPACDTQSTAWPLPPARCLDAWARWLRAWGQANAASRCQLANAYRSKGWLCEALANWQPSHNDVGILRQLECERRRWHAASKQLRPLITQRMHSLLWRLEQHAADCSALASVYFLNKGAAPAEWSGPTATAPQAAHASASSATPPQPAAVPVSDAPSAAHGSPPSAAASLAPTMGRLSAATIRQRKPSAAPTANAPQRPPPHATADIFASARAITIFVDEVELGTPHGAIAGIVWPGDVSAFHEDQHLAPAAAGAETTHGPQALPFISTHRRSPAPLRWLMSCPRAFPFVVPVRAPQDGPSPDYLKMVRIAIITLLGWLLPRPRHPVAVDVRLEHYGSYADGTDLTGQFVGELRHAAVDMPDRFQRWQIRSVQWAGKHFGYIPWGDLIGYWYLEQAVRGHAFGDYDVRQLHGYLPLSEERYRTLRQVCIAPRPSDILDLMADLGDSRLAQLVTQALREHVAREPDLVRGLLEELDHRYRYEPRHCARLKAQLRAVHEIAGPLSPQAPLRLRLMMLALEVQDANHGGDAERARAHYASYRELRPRGLELDQELVAHLDALLAVSHSDSFEHEAAIGILRQLHDDPRFPYLTPACRARHLSSLAQQASIQGAYDEAERQFAEAIALFQRDPGLNDAQRRKEIRQTSVYRAINALDGGLEQAEQRLAEALDGEPLSLVEALVAASPEAAVASQYQHHLLLRYAWTADRRELDAAILALRGRWPALLSQHPWELIGWYRALLLWRCGDVEADQAAEQQLREALRVCSFLGSGAAVIAITTAIALCGVVWSEAPDLRTRARDGIAELARRLGSDHGTVQELTALSERVAALTDTEHEDELRELTDRILLCLPFNYH